MYTGNPIYDSRPTMPPGLAGIPYMVGGVVAPFVGGVQHPYIPANQSVSDAYIAKFINDPLYKSMMSGVYGQMGYQLGNTIGGMRFIDSLAGMSGYSAGQIRADLANGAAAFGRSQIGSFVAPIADTLFNSAGLTGGSFVNSANMAFGGRMALMSPNTMLNPYNGALQSQSVAGASAMMSMLNGFISRDGSMMPNMSFTQGFDRERVTGLALRMAGAGAFNRNGIGFTDRLQAAAGGMNIGNLDYQAGDFLVGLNGEMANKFGTTSNFGSGSESAKKVAQVAREFGNKMKAGLEAMGAMRDLIKEIDGIEEQLTALTSGNWLRSGSGATAARDAIRKLHAVSMTYNLDPKQAVSQIYSNRGLLQDAAGIDGNMRFFGFDGGGMFGLSAQTELLTNVEDMITARGVRGDPILADRLRRQGTQAVARNMNTQAGVAAQVLAWGRQTGALTDQQASEFQVGLTSGDRSMMGDTINRMLTTVFGSASRGRELMQDGMFVTAMRQSMNDEAGQYAMRTIIRGADNEFVRRESITAAESRYAFSRTALADAGMRFNQSDADIGRIVQSVKGTLSELDGGDVYAQAFDDQYRARVAKGMKPQAALAATVRSFKNSSSTAMYGEKIDTAIKRQSAENNEFAFVNGGLASGQAKAVTDFLVGAGLMDGKSASEIRKLIRSGDGERALSRVKSMSSYISPAQQQMVSDIMADSAKKYEAAVATMSARKGAETLVDAAARGGYGSKAVTDSFDSVIAAVRSYSRSGKTDVDIDELEDALDQSGYSQIFGNKAFAALHKAVTAKGADLDKILSSMGAQSVSLRQMATANLKATGWDMTQYGFYGGGRYGGNSKDLEEARTKAISRLAQKLQDDSVDRAGDRQTIAQDLVDLLQGNKDWKQVLKIYDVGGKLGGALKDSGYEAAFGDWVSKRDEFAKSEGDISKVVKSMRQAGKYEASDRLEEFAKNLDKYSDDDINAFLQNEGVDAASKDAVMGALGKKRAMMAAKSRVDKTMDDLAGRDDIAQATRAYHANKDYKTKEVSKKLSAFSSFIEGLDFDRMERGDVFGGASGAVAESLVAGYEAAKELVSDADVAARHNVASINDLSDRDAYKTRLGIVAERAARGDQEAVSVMDKYKVAVDDSKATKIKGEIILKSGNDQAPGTLEGNMGGL